MTPHSTAEKAVQRWDAVCDIVPLCSFGAVADPRLFSWTKITAILYSYTRLWLSGQENIQKFFS